MPCLTGFYCPDYKTILPCPEGYYCPTGVTTPIKCQPLSSCPAGSSLETHYGLLLIAIAIDVVLFIAVLIKRILEVRRAGLPLSAILPPSIGNLAQKLRAGRRKRRKAADVEATARADRKEREPVTMEIEDVGEIQKMDERVQQLVAGFRAAMGGRDATMEFSFSRLGLTLPSGKTVLEGVSGQIRSGRMTAIMGPSGAGKTTFMNVLMGKVPGTNGELKINGVVEEMRRYKNLIGYVPQEDVMLQELTVREVIAHSAKCRLPRGWKKTQIETHVDNVINALGLSGVQHVQIGDTFTRGISGGQRKRVNVGMELAAAPSALFLDEPTSGLDSTSALDLAHILRATARLGLTIVSVIHQPRVEIFEAFDDVLLIAPGGRTAYFGPVQNVQQYFEGLGFAFAESANPADVLMDILSGRGVANGGGVISVEELVSVWERSGASLGEPEAEASAKDVDVLKSSAKARGASPFVQLAYAHNRSLMQQVRKAGSIVTECFVAGFAGLIMGISSNSPNYASLLLEPYSLISSASINWFIALYCMLVGISIALSGGPAGVKVFSDELPVYWRETASGHNSLAYYIGKNVSVLYRLTLSALHFTAIYLYFGRPSVPVSFQFGLIVLNFFFIYAIATIVSIIVRRENAPLVTVVVGLFAAVFCGFGLNLWDARDGGYIFLFNMGANRWAAEAQFWLTIKNSGLVMDLDYALGYCGYEPNKEVQNLFIMFALGIGYRVVGYILLILVNRQKQK
ncbi:hypothetical protein HDU96_005641 [Phlyctochytrium bullatum]|nr:hypothetical protein HDU96_005641 [Phlyctochytrium bullatum]